MFLVTYPADNNKYRRISVPHSWDALLVDRRLFNVWMHLALSTRIQLDRKCHEIMYLWIYK